MKKLNTRIVLLFLTMALSSNGLLAASKCSSLLSSLLEKEKINYDVGRFLLKRSSFNEKEKEILSIYFSKHNFSDEEIMIFVNSTKGFNFKPDLSDLLSYLTFVRSMKFKSNKLKALKDVGQINFRNSNSKFITKFNSKRKIYNAQTAGQFNYLKLNQSVDYLRSRIKFDLPTKDIQEIVYTIRNTELSDKQLEAFVLGYNKFNFIPEIKLVSSYIRFVETLKYEMKVDALKQINALSFKSISKDYKYALKYEKDISKINTVKSKYVKSVKKKLKKKHPEYSRSVLNKKTYEIADRLSYEYEKRYFGCNAAKWTPQRRAAGKKYGQFVTLIGMTTGTLSYVNANYDRVDWEDPFDRENQIWYSVLAYEISVNYLKSYLASKIISNPTDTVSAKALKKYLFSRTYSIASTNAYGALFGISKKEIEEKLKKVLNNPAFMKDLQQIVENMNQMHFVDRFKRDFRNTLAQFKLASESSNLDYTKINWDEIDPENINDDKLMEVLLMATQAAAYEEKYANNIVKTGSVALDRFTFHAAYGSVLLAKDIWASIKIYNTLCLGAGRPVKSLLTAIGIYTIDRLIFDPLYQNSKRMFIGQ